MTDTKQSIAVLIPTMNRPDTLKKTLNSYFSGIVIPDQIVVVDQSTEKNVRERIKNVVRAYADKSRVDYIFQRTPSSTMARNTAMRFCTTDIVIWSDDDVIVKKDTLSNIASIMSDSNISMIAGIDELTQDSKSIIGYFLGTKSFSKRNQGHVTKSMMGRFPNSSGGIHQTEWAMGFFFVIRRNLANEWNISWDEKLTGYAYAEDLDFSYNYYKKSHENGLRCITSDKVIVKHLASKEYRIPSRKHIFMFVINRAYLGYKHNMGKSSEIMMMWTNLAFLIKSKIDNKNYQDYKDAIKKCKEVKPMLKQGILKPEFYQWM